MSRMLSTALALTLLAGCHKDPLPGNGPSPLASPVPYPPDLVLDASMRGPDALWGRIQQGVGGPLSHLPGTIAGMLAAAGQLALPVASEVDGAQPAYGVVRRTGGALGWVVALKLRDAGHARASLVEGKTPLFTSHPAAGELTVLSASKPGGDVSYATALSSLGYLVVGPSEADLVALAPYATRTLPSRAVSPHGLVINAPHDALAGPVKDMITTGWALLRETALSLDASLRKEHGGNKPDFGNPAAVLETLDAAVQDKLAIVTDLDGATLTLDAGDGGVDVELTMSSGSRAGPSAKAFAAMKTGDAAPLLTLSRDTAAAALFRDDAQARTASAAIAADRAGLILGPALDAKGPALVKDALADWAVARGDWMSAGLLLDGSPVLTLRAPVTDGDKANRAVEKFLGLASLPGIHDMLLARLGVKSVSISSVSAAGGGSTSIATLQRADSSKGGDAAVAWAVSGGLLQLAAAESTAYALRASKEPGRLLGTDVPLAGKLGALRDRSQIVLMVRPPFGPDAPNRPSAVLGVGRDKGNGWSLLELDDELLRDLLSRGLLQ